MTKLTLSALPKTWIFDLDGTLLVHNGYKNNGDSFLPGALEFIKSIPHKDVIIILTARNEEYKSVTESFLKENGVRYNEIIFNIPVGERILINDNKDSGLVCSHSVALKRDQGLKELQIEIDNNL